MCTTLPTMSTHIHNEYQREPLPELRGGIFEYIEFKKEWKGCVAPGRGEIWQLVQLQKRTPVECNLSTLDTLKDAWAKLDSKYANPKAVNMQLIDEFIGAKLTGKNEAQQMEDLLNKVTMLEYGLRSVGLETELNLNHFLVNQAILKMPEKYQVKYGEHFHEKVEPAQTWWGILTEFLRSQVRMMEEFAWMFDEEPLAEEQTHKYDARANALRMNVDLKKLENEKRLTKKEKDRNKALTDEIKKLKKNQSEFQKKMKDLEIKNREYLAKECREVDANNENDEKFKEMEEEVVLLNRKVEQLSKENDSLVEETMRKVQKEMEVLQNAIDEKIIEVDELKNDKSLGKMKIRNLEKQIEAFKGNAQEIQLKIASMTTDQESANKDLQENGTQYLPIICLTIALSWMKLLMKSSWKRQVAKQVDYCTARKGLDQTGVVQANVALLPTSSSYKKNDKTTASSALAFPKTDSSMPLVPSFHKVGYENSVWGGEEDLLDLWGAAPYDDTGEMFDELEEVSEIEKLGDGLKSKNESLRSMIRTSENQEQQFAEESKSLEKEISQLKTNKRSTPTEDSNSLEILKQRISGLETMVRNLVESVANNKVKMYEEKLEETERSENSDDQEMKNQVGPATKEIETVDEAEAILAETDVVIFAPGAADNPPDVQHAAAQNMDGENPIPPHSSSHSSIMNMFPP